MTLVSRGPCEQHHLAPTRETSAVSGDVRVLCKLRTGEYRVPNLHLVDEMNTHCIGKLRSATSPLPEACRAIAGSLMGWGGDTHGRLFGLGGAFLHSKLVDAGDGNVDAIAGSKGECVHQRRKGGEGFEALLTAGPPCMRLLA
jgi:hypothetical protein